MRKNRDILGITSKKHINFSDWYIQVINKAELIEYTEVSGCYVLRPTACKIWELIQLFMNEKLEEMEIENAYFPLFIPEKQLQTEANHIEGFAPEVAWVTHSGDTKLTEKIAVRPTSETVIYPIYAKWIRSHRDLPLKLNQWCNVVRWEFKSCVPFLRSREFLWQEGHTVHQTKNEADIEVKKILDLYRDTYESLLCVPIIQGTKTEKEKFAGAVYTMTCEAFIPGSSKAIQAATSHCLGQGFAKMFNITYEDSDGESKLPWQNSWGFTTRSIGTMIMTHGDDKGLVLPPKIAPIQVVIIPIYKTNQDTTNITEYCLRIIDQLKQEGIRCKLDTRTNHNPGFLFSEWELKGIPFQFRIGQKEVEKNNIYVVRRDNKRSVIEDILDMQDMIHDMISEYQTHLLEEARLKLNQSIKTVNTWNDFMSYLDAGNMLLAPWCNNIECEESIKERSLVDSQQDGAVKSLCIPLHQDNLDRNDICINPNCDNHSKVWCLFGRSY